MNEEMELDEEREVEEVEVEDEVESASFPKCFSSRRI
jgi:hypothetical protein